MMSKKKNKSQKLPVFYVDYNDVEIVDSKFCIDKVSLTNVSWLGDKVEYQFVVINKTNA